MNDDQDAGHSREACIRGMEGIIRNLRTHYPHADVIVTYFVNPRMLAQLQKGETPLSMGAHEEVLETYQISRIHLARELATQIQKGKFTWNEFGGTHTPSNLKSTLCGYASKTFRTCMEWIRSHQYPKTCPTQISLGQKQLFPGTISKS